MKEVMPVDDDDDVSDNEVAEVFESTENNNAASETVVQYNAPGVVVTAITSAVFDEEEEKDVPIPTRTPVVAATAAVPAAKTSVKRKSPWATEEEAKKSKSEIRKINANKKRKHPSGGHKKHSNKKFKK